MPGRGMHRKSDGPSVQLSKSLSWLLRHGAEKEGFQFLPGGFLYVDEVMQKSQFKKFTVDDVKAVVSSNDKQRFHLETEEATGRLKIRANQGHSVQVEGLDLEPIVSADAYPIVIHGTYYRFWQSIRQQGLKRMKRTHIHFAGGLPGETGVISGMRRSCDLKIYINLAKALADGIQFFRSANNVILSAGNEDGVILPKYFQKVVDKRGDEIDLSDTQVFADQAAGASKSDCATQGLTVVTDDMIDESHEVEQIRKHRQKPTGKPRK